MDAPETLDQALARHRKELQDLHARLSNKKNATKKTRKGVLDECAALDRHLRDTHAAQLAALRDDPAPPDAAEPPPATATEDQQLATAADKLQLPAPPKKRNRQKERLARRAAEQEAASRAAASEAASMTDHRGRESASLQAAMQAHGLREVAIAPDGHCLFSAVADQLAQAAIPLDDAVPQEPGYRTVRRAAAAYMAQHAEDFAPFSEEPLEAYVARVRDTAEWGGQLELLALARRYGVAIGVLQDGQTEVVGEEGGERRRLWLAYYRHGYGLGEHYNSLRRKAAV